MRSQTLLAAFLIAVTATAQDSNAAPTLTDSSDAAPTLGGLGSPDVVRPSIHPSHPRLHR
jgi:hypothetical protein